MVINEETQVFIVVNITNVNLIQRVRNIVNANYLS